MLWTVQNWGRTERIIKMFRIRITAWHHPTVFFIVSNRTRTCFCCWNYTGRDILVPGYLHIRRKTFSFLVSILDLVRTVPWNACSEWYLIRKEKTDKSIEKISVLKNSNCESISVVDPESVWHQNDADPHADPTLSFTQAGQSEFLFFNFSHSFGSLQCSIFLFISVKDVWI